MTSSITIGPEMAEGRSVRDIVEHDHEQVNDAWCRKIFRQLLQSLERQYAMDMPHRAITPDTVVFHQNGEPLLLPSIVSDPAPGQAGDLTALAKLVHYAITQELVPDGPLHGRPLEGYSDALLTAVDLCMDPDPDLRPQNIDALRAMLGIVPLGSTPLARAPRLLADMQPEPVPEPEPEPEPEPIQEPEPVPESEPVPDVEPAPASEPVPVSEPVPAPAPAPTMRASTDGTPASQPTIAQPDSPPPDPDSPRATKRRLYLALAAGAIAILLAVFVVQRDRHAFDQEPPPPPQDGLASQTPATGPAPVDAPATPAQEAPAAALPDQPAPDASPAPATAPAATAMAPAPAASPASAAPPPAPTGSTTATVTKNAASPANPNASATYRLQIQPWGTVYVDGIDRGVSPPIKRLVLSPGRHTVRVTNPNFHERVLDVDTANGDGRIAIDFSDAE